MIKASSEIHHGHSPTLCVTSMSLKVSPLKVSSLKVSSLFLLVVSVPALSRSIDSNDAPILDPAIIEEVNRQGL